MYDTIHLYRWRTVGGRWPNFGSSAFMLPHCLLNLHVRNTQQNGMQMANNSKIRQFPFVSHSRYSTNMNNLKRGAKVYNTKFFSLCSWCEKCKSNTKMSRHTHLSCYSLKEKNERKIAASERNLFCCSEQWKLLCFQQTYENTIQRRRQWEQEIVRCAHCSMWFSSHNR